MNRSVVVCHSLAILVSIVAGASFTAEDARRRQDSAQADRAPVDKLVSLLTAAVEALPEDKWATDNCVTYHLDETSPPWKTILDKYDTYWPLLDAALGALGYRVNQVVKRGHIGSCPNSCNEAGFCLAVACRTSASITICWRDE